MQTKKAELKHDIKKLSAPFPKNSLVAMPAKSDTKSMTSPKNTIENKKTNGFTFKYALK